MLHLLLLATAAAAAVVVVVVVVLLLLLMMMLLLAQLLPLPASASLIATVCVSCLHTWSCVVAVKNHTAFCCWLAVAGCVD